MNELRELENYEARMLRKQHDDKNLTLMFILDLFFYFLISFPYTLMRLILDLFVKDQVKISLDFFVLFKSSLLAFHVHLIAKFFLMLTLNVNFRKSMAWAFSIQNSACWRTSEEDEAMNGGRGRRPRRRKEECCCSCFCCSCGDGRGRGGGGEHWWWWQSSSPTDSNLDAETSVNLYNKDYASCSQDDENFYHSTEFNSNYHQFYCPAEPAESDLIPTLLPSHVGGSKNNE